MKRLPLALTALAGWLLVNGVVHGFATSTDLHEHVADLQSPNALDARMRGFLAGSREGPRVVFAGDSVLAGRNLREAHGDDWDSLTLPAATERASEGTARVLNLGLEGVVWGDVDCLVARLLDQGADGLVLHLNPRPFALDFDDVDAQTTRTWLCGGGGAAAGIEQALAASTPVVAWRDLLQSRVFGGSLRSVVSSAVTRAVTPVPELSEEDAADEALLDEALWKMKAAGRYNDVSVSAEHASHASLLRLLARLKATRVPTVLLYVAEDVEAIAEQLDRAHYDAQRRAFLDLVTAETEDVPTLRFLPIPREDLAGRYDDHVHLTAEGYRAVAERVWAELAPMLEDIGAD